MAVKRYKTVIGGKEIIIECTDEKELGGNSEYVIIDNKKIAIDPAMRGFFFNNVNRV